MITPLWKRWLLVLWLLPLLVACNKRGGLQIGDPAPIVSLKDFHGKTVTLPDDLKGKVLLIRFWSLDCTFCDKDILLGLEPLYQKYRDRHFVPVAIMVSHFDPDDERLKRFERLSYPLLVDERGLIARRFGVVGLPASFVIDGEGILREKLTGETSLDEFEKLFTTVLN